jgi:S-adenosyl methyltransferase
MVDGPLLPFDAGRPSPPRVHDYSLGGKDNFAVDREVAAQLEEILPIVGRLVRESREFVARAVDFVAGQGVTQFIDVGCGMPAGPATHEVALKASPDARVAYVDNDAMVIAHAAALLAHPGEVAAVAGDARSPMDILASPELTALIDPGRPFCVILAFVLDFIDPGQSAELMAAFRAAMPAGSYLILSIGTDQHPVVVRDLAVAFRGTLRLHRHSREQIAGYVAGLEVAEPGMISARCWRPSRPPRAEHAPRRAEALGVVARKP